MQSRPMLWKSVSISSILALGVYLNTFNAEFAYDDNRAILTNSDLRPTTPWFHIFQNDFWGTPLKHSGSHKSYRPLCVLTFRLNYYLGELNATGYHVFNVVLHAVVTGLFTYFCNKLTRSYVTGLVAGMLFAVHPIHTEAVAGVVGRADSGAGLFFLLCLTHYLDIYSSDCKSKTNWKKMIFCVLLSALSLFTKEIGVTVIMVCAVYDLLVISRFRLWNTRESIKRAWTNGSIIRIFALGMTGCILMYIRLLIMGNSTPAFAPSDNPAASDNDMLTRLLTFLYLPVFNFWLLLYPSQLSFDWSMDSVPLLRSIFDPRNAISICFYLLYTVSVLVCQSITQQRANQTIYHTKRNDSTNGGVNDGKGVPNGRHKMGQEVLNRLSGSCAVRNGIDKQNQMSNSGFINSSIFDTFSWSLFSIAWISLSFLPATNLFFYVGFVIAERILYIPSMGYCLLIAIGFNSLYEWGNKKGYASWIKAVFILQILLFSVRTVIRNYDWQNEESLYRSGIQINPAKAWGNLANILAKQDKTTDAEEAYKAALRFRPNMADTHYNLGILLQNKKKYDEAASSYVSAIKFRPKLAAAHLNLGILYDEMGNKRKALEVLTKARNISDHGLKDPKAHLQSLTSIRYNIGKILFEMDQYQEAELSFRDALAVKPVGYAAHSLYNMLGQTLTSVGRHQEAEDWYRQALLEKPDHAPAHLTFAKHMHTMGKTKEAEKWFQKALHMVPVVRDAYIHYAQFLIDIGKREEAMSVIKNGVETNPTDAELHFFAGGISREQNQLDLSEVYYRKAVVLKPNELSYMMNLGALLHLRRKWREAEKIYEEILRREPNQELTETNLRKLRSTMQKNSL